MRNLRYFSLIATVLTCLLIAVPGNALFNSDVKKAKEFMKAGMYPQAIELLDKRIPVNNPDYQGIAKAT